MEIVEQIIAKVAKGDFEFSQHAVNRSILRHISAEEVREAIANSKMIEDYPDDKYGPSCLLLGSLEAEDRCIFNAAIHLVRS
jgi:hypothetical protein